MVFRGTTECRVMASFHNFMFFIYCSIYCIFIYLFIYFFAWQKSGGPWAAWLPRRRCICIDDPQSWFEDYRNIPERYSWWNTIFVNLHSDADGLLGISRTPSSLNKSKQALLSLPSLLKAFVSLKRPRLPVTKFIYICR